MTEMVFLCPSLSLCLYQCCKTVLLNKIISSDKDLIGLVLFGTVSVTLGHINLIELLVSHPPVLKIAVREGVFLFYFY